MKLNKLGIGVLAAVVLSIALGVWYFYYQAGKAAMQHELAEPVDNVALAVQAEIGEGACNADSPKSGGKYLLSDEDIDVASSGMLYLTNEHLFPIWVRIFEYETAGEFGAIFLAPQKSSHFQLPINNYTVIVESGSRWCNFNKGFVDASVVDSDDVISISANARASLRVSSFGEQASDMMLSLNSASHAGMSKKAIQGSGSLLLQRVVGGHYAVDGTINNVPLQFLVDTGATTVSIPASFAKHAGITACEKSKVMTAGGIVGICRAKARELTIGQFTLKNVELNYGKGLSEDTFLLGMNVISQFDIEQRGDVMKLTLH